MGMRFGLREIIPFELVGHGGHHLIMCFILLLL